VRLLCDEMLMRLGRWLRAAGYDTAIAGQGASDRDIVDQAVSEERVLITCDRKMEERRLARGRLVVLESQGLHAQAREIANILAIDWTWRPFSRCLVCNSILVQGEAHHLAKVPDNSREQLEQVFYCPACGKVFWHGSHVARMRRKLLAWKKTHEHI